MDETLTQKEQFFENPLNVHRILNENTAVFNTNFRAPIDVEIEVAPNSEGWTDVEIYNVNSEFVIPSRILPMQSGSGDPSLTNKRPIRPGLTIFRSDDENLDIYDGTLTVNDDGTWTVTKSSDNYHPTGNEPNYSKTGSQVLFELPDIYRITGYSYYMCSDFSNAVAYNNYAYIRTNMNVFDLQDYFASNEVDLILPLKQTEVYTISANDVKQTVLMMNADKPTSSTYITIGSYDEPVYGGKVMLHQNGAADLTVTHEFVNGQVQELENPIERQLEEALPLWSYFGINSVLATSGKILSVRYRSQTPVNGMMWQRDRALELRRRAIMAAAFQSLT